MKFRHTLIALSLFTVTTAPVLADHDSSADSFWNKERIGRAVGAGLGAVLGSKVGKGDGRNAAVALGTLAGYYLGGRFGEDLTAKDQRGIADSTRRALDTGEDQHWRNEETGVNSRIHVEPVNHRDQLSRHAVNNGGSNTGNARLQHVPGLEPIDDYYRATTRVNVRGGPSKRFVIIDQLRDSESVHVVGRVVDSDWLLISRDGRGQGFVYGPLLQAEGDSLLASHRTHSAPNDSYQCREVTQQIENRYGERESVTKMFCREQGGDWVANQ